MVLHLCLDLEQPLNYNGSYILVVDVQEEREQHKVQNADAFQIELELFSCREIFHDISVPELFLGETRSEIVTLIKRVYTSRRTVAAVCSIR